ncbi:MAG: DUF3108 domain-containing protein [Prevotellaceae bacterium]|nr:DUF3108 domain-containing protein [Prevotellaceae bacterium]
MRTKFFGILVAILILASGKVTGNGAVRNTIFKGGESVSYDLFYNWGFIWIHAGFVNFSVHDMMYKGKPSYRFSATGNSLKSFDKFYKVRDTLYSVADKNTLLPYYYKRATHEDSYWAQDEYFFTATGAKTTLITDCRRRKGYQAIDTLSFNSTVTDLVTVFYRVRNLNFNQMKIDEKHSFSIVYDDDKKPLDLHFKYIGKGEVELKNGKRYNCIKLRPLLVKGKVFKEEDGMTIYLSDDRNRIPIMIESKIRVGSIKAMLTKTEGTLYPFESIITTKK